jgi:hypothetical protein
MKNRPKPLFLSSLGCRRFWGERQSNGEKRYSEPPSTRSGLGCEDCLLAPRNWLGALFSEYSTPERCKTGVQE